MKRYLIRAGQSPLESTDLVDALKFNSFADNTGNLLYAQSVFRALMTSADDVLEPNRYSYRTYDPREVSEKYDAFVIPLADAFRPVFPEMDTITEFIRQLTIPCIVIGVGLRAPIDATATAGFSFDAQVKAFCDAVLEKSSTIGVRGERTAQYLTALGYHEDREFTVIGCPSLYTFGGDLDVPDPVITPDSTVSISATVTSTTTFTNDWIFENARRFKDYYFLPQLIAEYRLAYCGVAYPHKACGSYPDSLLTRTYAENRVRLFPDARSWLDFTGKMDFAFGGRLHGCIAALLGGTPALLFTKDARTAELADYHCLPSLPEKTLTPDRDIFDLVAAADFTSYKKRHAENFARFTSFLTDNGLDTIYAHGLHRGEAPFDHCLAKLPVGAAVSSRATLTNGNVRSRMKLALVSESRDAHKTMTAVRLAERRHAFSEQELPIVEKMKRDEQAWHAADAEVRAALDAFEARNAGVKETDWEGIVALGRIMHREMAARRTLMWDGYRKIKGTLAPYRAFVFAIGRFTRSIVDFTKRLRGQKPISR